MTIHNLMAKESTDKMLSNWRTRTWSNHLISADVCLSGGNAAFPSPDATMDDPTNNRVIAVEFKPHTETKRGILTGLGQCIAYLKNYSVSFLVIPERVDMYDIGTYMVELFEQKIVGKLPIGLVTFSGSGPSNIALRVDVNDLGIVEDKRLANDNPRYWAKHVDMPLHLLWLLLDIAYNLTDNDERSKKVWQICWDKYYFPQSMRNTLVITPSKIIKHDGNPLLPLSKVKARLRNDVSNGRKTAVQALDILAEKTRPGVSGDNLYNSYKKNCFPFIKGCHLWDEQMYLTEIGFDLHKCGKIYTPFSQPFIDMVAKITLIEGKHLNLIHDVERITRNKNFATEEEASTEIANEFDRNGWYRRNPGRIVTDNVGFLKYEKILWNHLGLLKKEGNSVYSATHGYNFDWEEITRVISQ
jgi:hypothetical protein